MPALKPTEYKMPNAKARDPHTIAFLQDGRIFRSTR
jgi:hypothetical protein